MHVSNIALLLLLPSCILAQSSTAPLPNPTSVSCPQDVTLVRSAGAPGNQSLSSAESTYVSKRASDVLPDAWKAYLQNVNTTSPTPLPSYISSILTNSSSFPKLGIATSGGGYRATLFGAAALSSLDGRNSTASQSTGTGGLLQAASYLAGLSGGGWLVTSLAQANFPTIPDLVFPPQADTAQAQNNSFGGFNAQVDLINPGPNAQGTADYLQTLLAEVRPKHDAGFPITVVDVWGRALSRHFVNGTTTENILTQGPHGAGILLSGISTLPSFSSHQQPFPIIVGDTFAPRTNTSELVPNEPIPLTNEIWEFNIYEVGSFDPALASFIPTHLLGTTNSSHCIAGFDQISYIAGISSNIFPSLNITEAVLLSSSAGPIIKLISSAFPHQAPVRLDSAAVPNPFQGVNPSTYSNTNETYVAMADGGLDGQVIPFQPLLVQARGVDTIIAIDASADEEDNFTNGTEVITSARRAALFGTAYPFPPVPATPEIFIQQNLTRRPTFFGCNDSASPLIIYIANGGPPASGAAPVTNTSTLKTTYTPQEVRAFLDQSFQIATQGAPVNGTTDLEWGACLACAVVDRARARTGAEREGVCGACFARYCWTGEGGSVEGSAGGGAASNGAPVVSGPARAVAAGVVSVLVGLWVV